MVSKGSPPVARRERRALPRHQRGAPGNPPGRFEVLHIEPEPDETCAPDDTASVRGVPTLYFRDASRSILSSNTSPDVPFNRSVNPYRGCEHGCIYCYARPTHEYLGLSAGLDFETRIFVKPRAPELLWAELSRRSWTPQVLAMSGVTDPYQPIERRLQLTRGCLAVLAEFRNPVGVITKSALVTRDLDLLAELATHRCVSVTLSVTTLEEDVRRAMEPRASTAERRFEAIARLRDRGVPAGVNIAPVVPGLTDHEIVPILKQAAQAGAQFAHFIVLRLPYGVKDLFEAWLEAHFPDRKQKVLHRIRELRGGNLTTSTFGERMRGTGVWAETLAAMFHTARTQAGIPSTGPVLSTAAFRTATRQPGLFRTLSPVKPYPAHRHRWR